MAIDLTKMKRSEWQQGIQRHKFPVDDAGGFTGTQTLYLSYPMRELCIINDSDFPMTVTATGDADYSVTFSLLGNETLEERLYPFSQVDITATGPWRYILRSGVIT
jgi:hypothetical protein